MDHPGLTGGEFQVAANAPNLEFFTSYKAIGDSRVHGIFVPKPETLLKENIGNYRVLLMPRETIPGVESLKALSKAYLDHPNFGEVGYHLGNVLVDIAQVANVTYKTALQRKYSFLDGKIAARTGGSNATLVVSAEQKPTRDSRVTLSDKTDLFGQRQLKLDWRIQEADRQTIAKGMGVFAAAVSAAGYGRVRLPREVTEGNFDSLLEIASHHMGTTRMSDSPTTGVVDGNCKVHGIDNLYIASSSVFPTSSWVNPTLTILALTIRLAGHLKQRYA